MHPERKRTRNTYSNTNPKPYDIIVVDPTKPPQKRSRINPDRIKELQQKTASEITPKEKKELDNYEERKRRNALQKKNYHLRKEAHLRKKSSKPAPTTIFEQMPPPLVINQNLKPKKVVDHNSSFNTFQPEFLEMINKYTTLNEQSD